MTDHLLIAGASLVGVMGLAYLVALFMAGGNPMVALKIWFVWVKKYWMIGVVIAAGVFAALISAASKREVREQVEDAGEVNVEADTIKAKVVEVNTTAKAEIAVAKSKDTAKKEELKKVKAIKDPMERRERLAEMLVVLMAVGLAFGIGCSGKDAVRYISALPKPLDVAEYVEAAQSAPEFAVPVSDECDFDKIPLPEGVLETADGELIKVPGGILISDCKAEQLILYKAGAERFYVERNQVALVYQSLNQACSQVESMYQSRLEAETTPDLWETIDFDAGVVVGVGLCTGIVYGVAPAFED